MKIEPGIKKMRRHLFGTQLLSFAGLFIVLGLVIFFVYERSVYAGIDQALTRQEAQLNTSAVDRVSRDPLGRGPGSQHNDGAGPFRATLVVFDPSGKITNRAMLGSQVYAYFKHLKLIKRDVNRKRTLTTKSGTFRTLLVHVPTTNLNPQYAGQYVLIIKNIDGQMAAITSFRQALIVNIGIFWALALALAYWLTTRSMRPVVAAWQRQQDFVANAAHELRAPLAVIQSQQEQLLTQPNATIIDQSEAIATSLDETKRLRHLTDDLLTIAKADSNTQELAFAQTALAPFFAQVVRPYRAVAKEQGKTLSVSLPQPAEQANFDPARLHQLAVILLDNALKYTRAGDDIWFTVSAGQSDWRLVVGNNGPSIAAADKAHIFERFYRVDPARNRHTGGAGLGLAIAQWIVRAHQGKLAVQDVAPHGVTFTARFPRQPKSH